MKRLIKWLLIVCGCLIVIILLALIVIPMVVDVQQYKPQIEKQVAKATGRPFTVGEDLDLSLFPWAGLSFSDLKMDNPSGFKEKEFLTVKSFEVRVKLLPLITKDIQVKRFLMKGPRIVLVRNKNGQGNWEGLGKQSDVDRQKPTSESKPMEGLPFKSLTVGEFAITEGSILWIDHAKGERKDITGVNLNLEDVSLDRPIRFSFSARLDKAPLSVSGTVGPVGEALKKGPVPIDLSIKALTQLDMNLKGRIENPPEGPRFDLAIGIAPFSPRKLVASLGQSFPATTSDPNALNRVALKAKLKGDTQSVSISDGALDIDESKLNFSVQAKEFLKPDVKFALSLDQIDLDRYLPPPGEKKSAGAADKPAKAKKVDYTPLRRLVVNGDLRVGKLKVNNARIQNLHLKVTGKKGVFNLDPIALQLYQGDASAKGALDVRKDVPKSKFALQAKGIRVGPLLKDVLEKEFLEGTTKARVDLSMAGDDPQRIKQTLNGKGELVFNDGAIKGIDLAGMVRNVKATFGFAEKGEEKPQTDFSELVSPFTIENGVVSTSNTRLSSPLLRVTSSGKADLTKETLDFRVEPKVVFTIKGQGDTKQRSGIMVPVLVKGNFASPSFRPDLKGIIKQQFEKGIPKLPDLKKSLIDGGEKKDASKPLEEKVKGLLKSFSITQ